MAETFYFEIIASDKKFYSGACEHVIFPAVDGLYGVLANHEDTVTAVVAGELRFKVDGEWKVCVVGGTPRRHRHHPCKRGQNKSRRTTQTETKPFAVLSYTGSIVTCYGTTESYIKICEKIESEKTNIAK